MAHVRRNIVCQNCRASTPLPIPTPQRTSQHPQVWSSFGQSIVFVCPVCGHGFRYSLQNFPPRTYEEPDPFEGREGLSLACTEAKCGDSNCKSRLSIHTVLFPAIVEAKKPHSWQLHEITCECGRPVQAPQ